MNLVIGDIPASQIRAGRNDRTVFADLDTLAASIARDGLIQPITVRYLDTDLEGVDSYQIVAGERRFRACTEILGMTEVRCIVRDLDEPTAARMMLHENVLRVDLDPIDEAAAYQARLDAGSTVEQMVGEGMRKSRIELLVPLLGLIDDAQFMVRRRQLSPTLARRMVPLDPNRQRAVLSKLAANELTPGQFGELCDRLLKEQQDEPLFDPASFLKLADWAKRQPKYGKLGQARVMLARCADALVDTDPDLAAEVRSLLASFNR